MTTFKEIVTRAVIGKGKKYFKDTYSMSSEANADTILGCWVINHKFKGFEKNGKIIIEGSYDVNMWYSHEDDSKTAVLEKTVEYHKELNVKINADSDLSSDKDIIVRVLKQPNCLKVDNKEDVIEFIIEMELGIEVVGETKVKISIEQEEEPWVEIIDEEKLTPEVEKQIEESVEQNFI